MQHTLIIGAGLTGLSTAYHLQQAQGATYDLYEQHATVGGLTRSVQEKGFTFDYTGHFLHSNNEYFSSLLNKLFLAQELQSIKRNAYVFTHKNFIPYPFQTHITQLPLEVACECIETFVKRSQKTAPKNFKQWLLQAFGKGMCKHFFFPYNKKILSYNLHKAMPEQGGRFVPKTTLKDLLASAHQSHESIGYNAAFLYPQKGGIQALSNKISTQLLEPVHTHHEVAEIDPYRKIITFTNGTLARYDTLVSTMPLDVLLKKTRFNSASALSQQHVNLVCNTVINVNLGINKPALTDKHWMYFPEKEYSFYRLGCWNAISPTMAPDGTSSLYAEASSLYPTQKEITRKILRAKRDMMKFFNFSENDICIEKNLILPHAYVIYNEWRKNYLDKLLNLLSSEFDIHSIGRFGAWKYSSMQEAILDGKHTAEKLSQIALKNVTPLTSHDLFNRTGSV